MLHSDLATASWQFVTRMPCLRKEKERQHFKGCVRLAKEDDNEEGWSS